MKWVCRTYCLLRHAACITTPISHFPISRFQGQEEDVSGYVDPWDPCTYADTICSRVLHWLGYILSWLNKFSCIRILLISRQSFHRLKAWKMPPPWAANRAARVYVLKLINWTELKLYLRTRTSAEKLYSKGILLINWGIFHAHLVSGSDWSFPELEIIFKLTNEL